MKNAEENLYNIYVVCRTAGILHINEVLHSSYKNEYSRCMFDFIYVTLFSNSNSYSINILGDAMDIATDICTSILYSKKESFDRSFVLPKNDLFRFLTKVIRYRLLDLLRKDKYKKSKEQLLYNENEIIEDPYCMINEIENVDKETEIISNVLKITNLFSGFCFLLIKYYCSYKPKELSAMLVRKAKSEEEFAELAVAVMEEHGYHLDLNTIHRIGYVNKSISPKAISDAARCVANTLKVHIDDFM